MENQDTDEDGKKVFKNVSTTDDGQKIIPLDYPFQYGDEQITDIQIPRIKAHHMRGINGKKLDDGDIEEMLKLIQALVGKGRKYIDNIDMVDIQTIGAVLQDFFPNGPTTGKPA